jgi:hypothetical protein
MPPQFTFNHDDISQKGKLDGHKMIHITENLTASYDDNEEYRYWLGYADGLAFHDFHHHVKSLLVYNQLPDFAQAKYNQVYEMLIKNPKLYL